MFRDRTILITGGGSGIGEALALQLASANKVFICGRSEAKLKKVSSKNKNIFYEVADISDPSSIDELFVTLKEKQIVLDVVFNNAGVVELWEMGKTKLTSQQIFEKINTNLSGAIAVTQHFINQANPTSESLIVNNTSEIVLMPVPILPLYSISKTGLSVFTKLLRIQLKNTKIKVVELLSPGVATDMPKQLNNPEKLISPIEYASSVIKGIAKGNTVYAPGKNVLLFKFFQRFFPTTGLNLIDKLSRKKLLREL